MTKTRTRKIPIILLAVLLTISLTPSFAQTTSKNVVLIVWDGAERSVVNELAAAGRLPFLSSLYGIPHNCNTEYGAMTITRPQHAMMLSGYHADVTGITNNRADGRMPAGLSIFENTPAEYTVVGVVAKQFNVADMLGFKETKVYTNTNGFDYFDNTIGLIVQSRQRILNIVRQTVASNSPYVLFIHLADIDDMGHGFGVNSLPYRRAMQSCDSLTADIYAIVASTDPLFIVTSDHGFGRPIPTQHTASPNTFLACNRPLTAQGSEMIDIATTYYAYLQLPATTEGKNIL